jgi:hypothetical protein
MVTLNILPCTNVTLTLGWITLFMGDMGEGALHREDEVTQTKKLKPGYVPHWGPGTKTNCPTDRLSQCEFKLNLRHCTANYRPALSSERAPYMKNKESNCHSTPRHQDTKTPRHQDTKTPRRTVRLTVGRNVTSTSTT